MIELDIKIGASDLYDYLLKHSYNGTQGIVGSSMGAVAILVGLSSRHWLLLILGIMALLYLPWTLYVRSRQQALLPVFQKPLHYVLDDEGIEISQDDAKEKQSWDDMVKAISTTRSIIVYTSKVNATIFPKRQMGDKTALVIEMISTHMPPSKVKIKA